MSSVKAYIVRTLQKDKMGTKRNQSGKGLSESTKMIIGYLILLASMLVCSLK